MPPKQVGASLIDQPTAASRPATHPFVCVWLVGGSWTTDRPSFISLLAENVLGLAIYGQLAAHRRTHTHSDNTTQHSKAQHTTSHARRLISFPSLYSAHPVPTVPAPASAGLRSMICSSSRAQSSGLGVVNSLSTFQTAMMPSDVPLTKRRPSGDQQRWFMADSPELTRTWGDSRSLLRSHTSRLPSPSTEANTAGWCGCHLASYT
mmetsp:Transcript_52699/g.132477  ORF Transcript_52699/g.132477 Transcript_52699/m.132477 type:complete len:206 (-) Transcript_52699:278-895(-)